MSEPAAGIRRSSHVVIASLLLLASLSVIAARQAPAPWPPPIDLQAVRDQDDMTWDDFVPIPGARES